MGAKEVGTFKIEKDCECKFSIKNKKGSKGERIDLVLDTTTGEIKNVICSAKIGTENYCSIKKDTCPYKKDQINS